MRVEKEKNWKEEEQEDKTGEKEPYTCKRCSTA